MKELFTMFLVIISLALVPLGIGIAVLPRMHIKSLQWLLGVFLSGIFWLLCYVLGIPKPVTAYAYGALVILCAVVVTKKRWHLPRLRRLSECIPECIMYGTLAILFIYSITDIYANPITAWDGFAIWLAKAKDFYFWSPIVSLTFVHYPGLGSMVWSVIMTVFGFHEALGRFVYPFVYVAFFSLLGFFFRVKKNKALFAVVIALVATVFFPPSLYSGYQDDFLSLTTGIAALLLCVSMIDGKRTDLFLLGCFFSGSLALIKNEGIMLGFILLTSFIAVHMQSLRQEWKQRHWQYVSGIAVFIVLQAFWSVAIAAHGIDPRNIQGDQITLQGILLGYKNLSRLPVILPYVYNYTAAHLPYFAMLVISIPVAFLISSLRKVFIFIWTNIVLHIGSVVWVYLATTAPLVWHLDTSFDRLMDQQASLYVILCILIAFVVLSGKRRLDVHI